VLRLVSNPPAIIFKKSLNTKIYNTKEVTHRKPSLPQGKETFLQLGTKRGSPTKSHT